METRPRVSHSKTVHQHKLHHAIVTTVMTIVSVTMVMEAVSVTTGMVAVSVTMVMVAVSIPW